MRNRNRIPFEDGTNKQTNKRTNQAIIPAYTSQMHDIKSTVQKRPI